MSAQALSWALSRATRGVPQERRLVLIFLAHHADRDGWVFVSKATLAEELGLTEESLRRTILQAIELRWLGEHQCTCPVPPAYEAIQRNRRPRLLCFLGAHRCGGTGGTPVWGQEPANVDADVISLFQRAQGGRTS